MLLYSRLIGHTWGTGPATLSHPPRKAERSEKNRGKIALATHQLQTASRLPRGLYCACVEVIYNASADAHGFRFLCCDLVHTGVPILLPCLCATPDVAINHSCLILHLSPLADWDLYE